MSKTVLMVQGYAAAQERIHRHWPYYLKAGCDIVGVQRDIPLDWPKERLINVITHGHDAYVGSGDLVGLMVECFNWFSYVGYHDYDSVLIVENDAIFTRPVPEFRSVSKSTSGGLCTVVAGGRDGAFHGSRYFHTPWWTDVHGASHIADWNAPRMIAARLTEGDFPDRFLGLFVDLYGMDVTDLAAIKLAYSVNRIDRPEFVQQARQSIKDGAFYVHGIKTGEQLKEVTEGLV